MEEKVKMMIGAIVIIGIMILSYKIFPRNAQYDGGLNIPDEIKGLEDELKKTGEQTSELPILGPGGCTTIEECDAYCLLPENETECLDIFLPAID